MNLPFELSDMNVQLDPFAHLTRARLPNPIPPRLCTVSCDEFDFDFVRLLPAGETRVVFEPSRRSTCRCSIQKVHRSNRVR